MCGINYYTQGKTNYHFATDDDYLPFPQKITATFCVAVFIFAAPPHDCSTLVRSGGDGGSGGNLTASDDGGGGGLSGDGPSMSIVYDYSSLFPTLTSDVRQSRSHWTTNKLAFVSPTSCAAPLGMRKWQEPHDCAPAVLEWQHCWVYHLGVHQWQVSPDCSWSFKIVKVDSVDHNLITGCALFCLFSFGRRPTVLLSHIAYFLGGLLTLFSPYFWLIGISRFMVGMAHHTVSHLPYLIGKTASIFNTENNKWVQWED